MEKARAASLAMTSHLTSGLPLSITSLRPSQYLISYSSFLTQNAASVTSIESALRSLTYIIPGRFRESELLSETLHSSIQLLSLYHDTLLSRAVSRLPPQLRPPPSPQTRYTKYWTAHSPTYKRTAQLLQVLQYTELLIEMGAKRRGGERRRWQVVVMLESIKAICRLILLRSTGSRPLVSPPLPEREDLDPAVFEKTSNDSLLDVSIQSLDSNDSRLALPHTKPYQMPLTSLLLPPLPSPSTPANLTHYLVTHVLTPTDILSPPSLLRTLSTLSSQSAEVLYILRPVVYAFVLAHYTQKGKEGKRDWRPWLVGVALEIAARQIAWREREGEGGVGAWAMTGLETEEVRKRGWGMAWWMARGPFWENVSR